MTPEVAQAIDEIAKQFTGHPLLIGDDLHGGACVIVEDLPLGPPYAADASWVGFHVTHNCPYADTYPHFMRADLSRRDNLALGEGISPGHIFPQAGVLRHPTQILSRPALQISRRSNRRDSSGIETPKHKLLKVLQWIRSR